MVNVTRIVLTSPYDPLNIQCETVKSLRVYDISRYRFVGKAGMIGRWTATSHPHQAFFFPPLGYDGRKPSALNSGFCKGLHSRDGSA